MHVLTFTIHFIAVSDFDNTSITIIVDPGETTALVSIPIFDDDLLESVEIFEVVIEIGGVDTDGAVVGQPALAQVSIISEDGWLTTCHDN